MKCSHYLDEYCLLQLRPCAFFKEAFCRPAGIDPNADFIFNGVLNGFDIVDDVVPSSYHCSNYSSILDNEFKSQMDDTVTYELSRDKVSITEHIPHCVHAMGAVRKASGKLRPITDCKRPLGSSINNYMLSTCHEFSYTHIDDVTDALIPGAFMAVLDIKSAYRFYVGIERVPDIFHRQLSMLWLKMCTLDIYPTNRVHCSWYECQGVSRMFWLFG